MIELLLFWNYIIRIIRVNILNEYWLFLNKRICMPLCIRQLGRTLCVWFVQTAQGQPWKTEEAEQTTTRLHQTMWVCVHYVCLFALSNPNLHRAIFPIPNCTYICIYIYIYSWYLKTHLMFSLQIFIDQIFFLLFKIVLFFFFLIIFIIIECFLFYLFNNMLLFLLTST